MEGAVYTAAYTAGLATAKCSYKGAPWWARSLDRACAARSARCCSHFFCESRPGLLLWVALNASCAVKQYELSGVVTTPMLLVNAFQLLYVADYFVHEEALLSTWDIKHEPTGFGHPITYFYIVYVLILLIHRERRDHRTGLQRYGRDWEAYCRRVPWPIVPGLY